MLGEQLPILVLHRPVLGEHIVKLVYHWKKEKATSESRVKRDHLLLSDLDTKLAASPSPEA